MGPIFSHDLKVEFVPLESLKPFAGNPRKNAEAVEALVRSIEAFGYTNPILARRENKEIIAGHTRLLALQKIGAERAPVIFLDLDEKDSRVYSLFDNKSVENTEWDIPKLGEVVIGLKDLDIDFSLTGFSCRELGELLGNEEKPLSINPLSQDYVFPPFSVLNSASGDWQRRKRAWFSLGLKNDIDARRGMKATGSYTGSIQSFYIYKDKAESLLGQKLSNKDFIDKYLRDFLPKDSLIETTETGGILSIFDPVLTELMYRWFCPPGGLIIDPFAGGCVRGIVACLLGYKYLGIDVNEKQILANKKVAEPLSLNTDLWIYGDSREGWASYITEADFIFSCPPYPGVEIYTNDPRDISTMSYPDFRKTYVDIIAKAVSVLRDNRFAGFLVGQCRDKKNGGAYHNFVSDTISAFLDAGCKFYNELIFVNPVGSLPQRIRRAWGKSRKIGLHHQTMLIFYKGDTKKIRELFSGDNLV